jgi:hypothetical protein
MDPSSAIGRIMDEFIDKKALSQPPIAVLEINGGDEALEPGPSRELTHFSPVTLDRH